MTFVSTLLVAMTTLLTPAQDQRPIEIPRRVQGAGSSRLGVQQFKLIRTSLKLSEEQTGEFETLIETYKARVMEEALALLGNIAEMQQVSEELKAARTAKDAKRIEELEQRMRALRPETRPANEFYESLGEILDEQQKERLPKLREMLKGKGGLIDMRLKPRQVGRANRRMQFAGCKIRSARMCAACLATMKAPKRLCWISWWWTSGPC